MERRLEKHSKKTFLKFFSLFQINKWKTHEVIYSLYEIINTHIAYFNLMIRFPHHSSRGDGYIIVTYHNDVNAILVEPVRNRQVGSLTDTWRILNEKF